MKLNGSDGFVFLVLVGAAGVVVVVKGLKNGEGRVVLDGTMFSAGGDVVEKKMVL